MSLVQSLKPGISKRFLLFLAALAWTFAGGMLLSRGFTFLKSCHNYLVLRLVFSVIVGLIFYWKMFSKISLKHSKRILSLAVEKPCLFSFFNIRSYLIMIVMISSGIFLRTSGLVSVDYLSIIYITMGIPLLASSIRFYYFGINYHEVITKIDSL